MEFDYGYISYQQYENTPNQIYWKFHHQKLNVFR